MAQLVSIKRKIEITLKFSEREAELLRTIIQNPLYPDESEFEIKFRGELFNILSQALQTNMPNDEDDKV